jgi:CheY-like chemotaxis protein
MNLSGRILVVEDDEADCEMIQRAAAAFPRVKVTVVHDGVEGLEALRASKDGLPDLVLLDLNMPRMDGREFLKRLKSDPRTKRVPVAIFTTSDAESDVAGAYDLGANCYLTKPMNLDEFSGAVRSAVEFFLGRSQRPPAAL